MNQYARYAGMAFQWGILLGGAVWGGMKADAALHFKALFIIILPLIALAYLFWSLLRDLPPTTKNKK